MMAAEEVIVERERDFGCGGHIPVVVVEESRKIRGEQWQLGFKIGKC